MLTDTELSAIRARAEAATPGPWHSLWDDDPLFMSSYFVATKENASPWDETTPTVIAATLLQTKAIICHESGKWEEDAAFIAAARTDIPALLAHIDEQKKEIEHLRRALEYACKFGEKLCYRFGVVARNGCFDCPAMIERNRVSPSPFCKNWLSASLDATKEAASE